MFSEFIFKFKNKSFSIKISISLICINMLFEDEKYDEKKDPIMIFNEN